MNQLKVFWIILSEAFRTLLPIIGVVVFFQVVIVREIPDNLTSLVLGLGIVVVGSALFLQGLDMSVFPMGKSLSNRLVRLGSLPVLMGFGFCMGFVGVMAEPVLLAVSHQATQASTGEINGLVLRLIVALSIGAVIALGIMRMLLGHPIQWYLIGGYSLVLLVTFFAPEEIVGLAYDSGGVTTNIVTVPLIAALSLGLAGMVRGRNPLHDGFGLVALAVIVPMITVQLYGIVLYGTGAVELVEPSGVVATPSTDTATVEVEIDSWLEELLMLARDMAPLIAVVVLRRPLSRLPSLVAGFVLTLAGLYAFVLGLELSLFPIGINMAEQLLALDNRLFIYLFAFMIGFASTLAEPALVAVGRKAEQVGRRRFTVSLLRLIVATGVATGITVGVYRIISGDSIHMYILMGYSVVLFLTWLAPKEIIALAFDLGGVSTSEITVPLVMALGMGLATHIDGRNLLIDGFGLIAFASIFPIISVMLYAIIVRQLQRYIMR